MAWGEGGQGKRRAGRAGGAGRASQVGAGRQADVFEDVLAGCWAVGRVRRDGG